MLVQRAPNGKSELNIYILCVVLCNVKCDNNVSFVPKIHNTETLYYAI